MSNQESTRTHGPEEIVRLGPIHHIVINVSDLERSLHFYRDLLGLRCPGMTETSGVRLERMLRLPAGSRARVAFLNGGRGMGSLELVEWQNLDKDGAQVGQARSATDLGYCITAFVMTEPELLGLHRRLEAANVVCLSEPQQIEVTPTATVLVFSAEDPDGNLVEFFVLPPQAEHNVEHDQ